MAKRELVFDDGKSRKFWKISLKGTSHTVTFGRLGTTGQTRMKDFDTVEEAKKSYDKLVGEKLGKGYVDAKKTAVNKAPVTKNARRKVATSTKRPAKSRPTSTAAKKTDKKLSANRESEKIRCVQVTRRSDKTMDRGMWWDPPVNPLPTRCSACGFPDLDFLPRRYYLIKSMAMSPNEMEMAVGGNFLVRERVQRILKAVAPGACRFRSTHYRDTAEKAPWLLAIPQHRLETGRIMSSIKRCKKCGEPERAKPPHDYDKWYSISETDPAHGKTDTSRRDMSLGRENPRTRDEACREAEWDLFHSAQWVGSGNTEGAYESHNSGRELFFSLRLWELLKRAKMRSNLKAELRWGTIEAGPWELEWVDKKLTLLRKRGIPLVPQGDASEEDTQWLRDYIKEHARPSKPSISFASFEKKQGFKLPKSFKDFLTKVGTKTFRDIDGEEGFVARILTPNKFDCKNFRSGIARTKGDPETTVDGIMFAATDHGDCFCFDVKKGHKEYAVILYDHEYERFEPYAPNFAACVRRFVGE